MKSKLPILHRTVSYSSFGEPSNVLSVLKARRPNPGPQEVLVRMKLSAINPSDLITIRGAYAGRVSLPNTPGFEGVGTVVDIGAGVTHPAIGTRVLALRGQGTWQEYVAVLASEAISVPDGIDDRTAAQLYINPLTAWLMLKERLKVQHGDTIAVNAGNSAFGYIVVKLSKLFNINIISIVRRQSCVEDLKSAGASLVINTAEVNLKDAITAYTRGFGVKFALDAIGGADGAQLADCVRDNGIMLHYGLLSGIQLAEDVYLRSAARNVAIENYFLREWVHTKNIAYRQCVFREMMDAFIEHGIKLAVDSEYPMERIVDAVKSAEIPDKKGKVLLGISEGAVTDRSAEVASEAPEISGQLKAPLRRLIDGFNSFLKLICTYGASSLLLATVVEDAQKLLNNILDRAKETSAEVIMTLLVLDVVDALHDKGNFPFMPPFLDHRSPFIDPEEDPGMEGGDDIGNADSPGIPAIVGANLTSSPLAEEL